MRKLNEFIVAISIIDPFEVPRGLYKWHINYSNTQLLTNDFNEINAVSPYCC